MRGIPVEEADDHFLVHRELEDMREAIEYENKVQATWIDCFKPERKQLYRTLLGAFASLSLVIGFRVCGFLMSS